MAEIKLTNVNKSFGSVQVLRDINLHITTGEFVVFVGPSGCGKSTLLRMIAGLENITSGTLEIDNVIMNDVPSSERGVAMVFQSYALYPHMTVRENISFSLKIAKHKKSYIEQEVSRVAELLQLTPYLDRLPKALSGGQRQRVAIGRTIVRNPTVFLFDEPLSNLDAKLRVAMRIEIANINESLPEATMIYVTHDQVEAMTLADRIVVLSTDGQIEQVGSPLDLYTHPTNLFVAEFIGSPAMNIISTEIVKSGASTTLQIGRSDQVLVPIPTTNESVGTKVHFGVRPEDFMVVQDDDYILEGTLSYIEELGDLSLLYLHIGTNGEPIVVKSPGISGYKKGEKIRLNSALDKRHLFNEHGKSLHTSHSHGVAMIA